LQLTVVDLVTAQENGVLCDCCSDPIDRGDRAAVLSNGEHIHDGCYQIVQAAAEEVVTTPAIPRLSA